MARHDEPPHVLDAIAQQLAQAAMQQVGRPNQAMIAADDAVQGWRIRVAEAPDDAEAGRALTGSLARLGHLQAAVGDRRAERTFLEVVARRRGDGSAPEALAEDLSMLGAIQMITGPDRALPTLAESVELHGRLVKADAVRWQGPLARGLLCLAALLADSNRLEEARAAALDLFDVVGPRGFVDVDRAEFVQTVTDLVRRVAPPSADSDEAQALRSKLATLRSTA